MSTPIKQTIKQTNTSLKQKQRMNEQIDISFLISEAIKNGIYLEIQRKEKKKISQKQHKNIKINRFEDQNLQAKVDEQLNQWKESYANDTKIEQRYIDQTKENIICNVLIEALKERGNSIESYEQKKSKKIIPRRRIYSYNGMKQEETREIGAEMNRKILEKLPIQEDMKKKESAKILYSLDDATNGINTINETVQSNQLGMMQ